MRGDRAGDGSSLVLHVVCIRANEPLRAESSHAPDA
jgi:hypothetical protein